MNFFENFGRVNTTSISKIAVKSHKFCVKNLLDTRLRLLPVFSVNKGSRGGGGGGGRGPSKILLRHRGRGILPTLRTITRGEEGEPNFRQQQRYVTFE